MQTQHSNHLPAQQHQQQSRESATGGRPTRQSQQRINPHHQIQTHQKGKQQSSQSPKPQNNHGQQFQQPQPSPSNEEENLEKLKSMLTQVHRGESAPRVTGAYAQGLKQTGSTSPQGGVNLSLGRNNNRYQSSSVNNPNNNRSGNSSGGSYGGQRRPQDVVFRRSQRPHGLLGPQPERFHGKKTLVLDLDETLVHSQFTSVGTPDYTIPVDIEGRIQHIYVMKRPGAEYFLQEMAKYFEVCIFTASLSKYADPLMNMMDPRGFTTVRLFREHCTFLNGIFVKDMSQLGRNLKDTIIIDNSPTAYLLQPEQGLPIVSWYDDPQDRALYDYIPLLIEMSKINDMREAITGFVRNNTFALSQAMSVVARILEKDTAEAHRRQLEMERARKNYIMQQIQANSTATQQSQQTNQSAQKADSEAELHLMQQSKKQPLINSWFNNGAGNHGAPHQAASVPGPSKEGAPSSSGQEYQERNSALMINTEQSYTNIPVFKQNQAPHPQAQTEGLDQNNEDNSRKSTSSKSKKKVTNITNIIYNFNYGTQPNQPSAAASQTNAPPQPPLVESELAQPQQKVTTSVHMEKKIDQGSEDEDGDEDCSSQNSHQNDQNTAETAGKQSNQAVNKQTNGSQFKRRPNTGSGAQHQHQALQRQSLKDGVQQVQGGNQSPGSAATILKSKNGQVTSSSHQQHQSAPSGTKGPQTSQTTAVIPQQIAVQMSRKSTIDNTKDNQGKMLVVLDTNNNAAGGSTSKVNQYNQRGSSQKVVKQESALEMRGQANQSFNSGHHPLHQHVAASVKIHQQHHQTQLQKQVLQHHSANSVKNHLKSKLKQRGENGGGNPFATQGGHSHPKVLPIEISNQSHSAQNRQNQNQQHLRQNQLQAPQLYVNNGTSNKAQQSALLPTTSPNTTTNGGLKIQKNQFLMMKQDIMQQKRNNGMIKAFTPSASDHHQNNSIFNFNNQGQVGSVSNAQPNSAAAQTLAKNHQRQASQTQHSLLQSQATVHSSKNNQSQGGVRSFSQNQGSRKAINNILVYNQGQSLALSHGRQKQSSVLNHHTRTPSVQMQTHGQQQSQILYNQVEPTLTNPSPKTTANSNIMLEKGSNHSVLVEKYSNFFGHHNNHGGSHPTSKSTKGGGSTPTASVTTSDLTLLRGNNQSQQQASNGNHSHQRTTSQQMINKLRNSQNQALNTSQAASSGKPQQIPRSLLVIPQNAVVQANQHQSSVYNALQNTSVGKNSSSQRAQNNGASTQVSNSASGGRNQRLIISGSLGPGPNHQKSETPKGSSQEHVPSLLKGEGVQIVLPPNSINQQLSFQIGNPVQNIGAFPKSTTHHYGKQSPKNAFNYPSNKHANANPFKSPTAASSSAGGGVGQFVNQPHHLHAASQGLSQIMAASAAVGDNSDAVMGLNLQNLYPQSQSPMSFKQMQNAKRQKRANLIAAAHKHNDETAGAVSNSASPSNNLIIQPIAGGNGSQSRQSPSQSNSHQRASHPSGKASAEVEPSADWGHQGRSNY